MIGTYDADLKGILRAPSIVRTHTHIHTHTLRHTHRTHTHTPATSAPTTLIFRTKSIVRTHAHIHTHTFRHTHRHTYTYTGNIGTNDADLQDTA